MVLLGLGWWPLRGCVTLTLVRGGVDKLFYLRGAPRRDVQWRFISAQHHQNGA